MTLIKSTLVSFPTWFNLISLPPFSGKEVGEFEEELTLDCGMQCSAISEMRVWGSGGWRSPIKHFN